MQIIFLKWIVEHPAMYPSFDTRWDVQNAKLRKLHEY